MFYRHGLRKHPIYIKWAAMMRRCYNPSQQNYERYGGSGITVDLRWHDVVNFYHDMGDCPEGLTLDRIDPTQGYYKQNCRWATVKEQNDSRRHVQKLVDGQVAAQVATANGISIDAFHRRVQRGWDLELAATKPTRKVVNGTRRVIIG